MTTATEAPIIAVTRTIQRKWYYPTPRRGSERPDGKSIAYFDFSALDDSVWDQIINRRHRPFRQVRPLVEAALREAGIEFTSLRWSQHAGCSCPCSPGFRIEGGARGYDYWIGAKSDTIEATTTQEAGQ